MSECKHGELARSCWHCEKDSRIAELEAENEKLKEMVARYADIAAREQSDRALAEEFFRGVIDTLTATKSSILPEF